MDWGEFLKLMVIIRAKTISEKINLFIKIADEDGNGMLSQQEIFFLTKKCIGKLSILAQAPFRNDGRFGLRNTPPAYCPCLRSTGSVCTQPAMLTVPYFSIAPANTTTIGKYIEERNDNFLDMLSEYFTKLIF